MFVSRQRVGLGRALSPIPTPVSGQNNPATDQPFSFFVYTLPPSSATHHSIDQKNVCTISVTPENEPWNFSIVGLTD